MGTCKELVMEILKRIAKNKGQSNNQLTWSIGWVEEEVNVVGLHNLKVGG
jgi:hypothetical protein